MNDNKLFIGDSTSDITCKPCKEGFYSSSMSSTLRCKRHTNCNDREILRPGNATSDTVCGQVKKVKSNQIIQNNSTKMIQNEQQKEVDKKMCLCKRDTKQNCCSDEQKKNKICNYIKKLTGLCKDSRDYGILERFSRQFCKKLIIIKIRHCYCYKNPQKKKKCLQKRIKMRKNRQKNKIDTRNQNKPQNLRKERNKRRRNGRTRRKYRILPFPRLEEHGKS